MLQKEDSDLLKKCMEYEVDGPRPSGRRKGHGEWLWKKTVKNVNWRGRMLWIIVDGGSW